MKKKTGYIKICSAKFQIYYQQHLQKLTFHLYNIKKLQFMKYLRKCLIKILPLLIKKKKKNLQHKRVKRVKNLKD